MTAVLDQGRYHVTRATKDADLTEVFRLRHLCFRALAGGQTRTDGTDRDAFDDQCLHLAVRDRVTGGVVGGCRVALHGSGDAAAAGYVGQSYDLGGWRHVQGTVAELGRFCVHPDHGDPGIVRMVWGSIASLVLRHHIRWLMGCASFEGTEPAPHHAAFAALAKSHLGPDHLRPTAAASEVVALKDLSATPVASDIPGLLRSYLAMGAWVSDQAVIDRDLGTLHVFTALKTSAVPAARARALLALAT